jgi:hypothetical protein
MLLINTIADGDRMLDMRTSQPKPKSHVSAYVRDRFQKAAEQENTLLGKEISPELVHITISLRGSHTILSNMQINNLQGEHPSFLL